MKFYKFLIISILLCEIVNAKVYEVNLIIDNEVLKYEELIKSETKTLFDKEDIINFKINSCQINQCFDLLNKNKNSIFIFQNSSEIKNDFNHVITYDNVASFYDENRLTRTIAISILEFLKENKKSKSIFLRSDFEVKKQKENNSNLEKFDLIDIYNYIQSNNLLIKQNKNELISSNLDLSLSKDLYKPTIELFSNVIQMDGDRAKYSNGLYSEGVFDIGIKLTQILYSNEVIQNIKIKELLDKSNKNKIAYENDELVYKAFLTYLNILKLEKYIEIIEIKKEFIEQNLNFSKQRIEIGAQYRNDLYRWESELANINIQLSNSQKEFNNQKYELENMILVNKEFNLKKYDLNSLIFKLNQKDAIDFLSKNEIKRNLLEKMVTSHYSLKQCEELINVKSEEKDMNEKSRYLPTVAFEAQAKKIENRYGEGSSYVRPWDNNEYQMVLNFNLPIYEGGLKANKIEKNEIELLNLKLKYSEVKNMIEKNINQNINSLTKSYEKIDYSKVSEKFAKKNYDLVLDRYKNGQENIITLLDAQDSYIVSKLNEIVSEFDYLINLTSIYFFSGNINILVDENKKTNFEKDILGVLNEN